MTYVSPYKEFIFESYLFDSDTGEAEFNYSFDGELRFTERVAFSVADEYDRAALDRALFSAFIIAGISYYKAFPARQFLVRARELSEDEASFYSEVYLHGLSQFVYENRLDPTDIAVFAGAAQLEQQMDEYKGSGSLVLQSGGKDSLLLIELLSKSRHTGSAWYMQQSLSVPGVVEQLGWPLRKIQRHIDRDGLGAAKEMGGLNGHVPVTYIVLGYAVIDAILHSEATVLAAIGHEGEEPHAYIGDYPVTHQWSKTWGAEKMFSRHVERYISAGIRVGSPLRGFSELKIAELFVKDAWGRYSRSFSSCNVANYQQGHDNRELTWCGLCPKCANSYLLFAPFVEKEELVEVFGGDLFVEPALIDTFKGLLGVDGIEKPFECVGEIDELRLAYHKALVHGYSSLGFEVPDSSFDADIVYEHQAWARSLLPETL